MMPSPMNIKMIAFVVLKIGESDPSVSSTSKNLRAGCCNTHIIDIKNDDDFSAYKDADFGAEALEA